MLIGESSQEKYSPFAPRYPPKSESSPMQTSEDSARRVGDGRVDEDQIDIDLDRLVPVLRRPFLSVHDGDPHEREGKEHHRQEKGAIY